MEVTAITRYARISPRKARNMATAIRGLRVEEALKILAFSERKGGFLIRKTMKSAIANAQNNLELSVEGLRVKEAVVETGPSFRRGWARARGSVSPIQKKTSHIRITLTDEKAAH
jgi:large subunit ribosomal protein L22